MAGPGSADQIQEIWWISWAQYALAHGHNPFFTTWQNAPVGLNALVNTSILALGTLMAPVTSVFGPIVAWNVLEVMAPVVSAMTMCLVLRRWTHWWPAAFVGGLLYGFSAYETTSLPHLFVAFVPLPPLFFLLLYELLARQRWPAVASGVLLGLVCGIQYLISSEVLASMVILGVLACVLFLLANRRRLTGSRSYAIRAGTVALGVGAISLAGPVLYTLFGPGHLEGVPNSPSNLAQLHGDLLATFVPGSLQRFHLPNMISGYQLNAGAIYLGIPFLVAVGVGSVLLRRRGVVMMAGALAAISFVLSLGSTLYVDGRDTHVPLPFAILAHLPVVQGLLSTRFALYTVLFGSAVIAIGLDTLRERMAAAPAVRASSRRGRVIGVGVPMAAALVVALPLLPARAQSATATNVPSFFISSLAGHHVAPGSTVLAYPYPDAPRYPGVLLGFSYSARYQGVNDMLLDQAQSGMPFKVIGGYGWRPVGSLAVISPSVLEPNSVKDLFDFAFYGVSTRPGQSQALESGHLPSEIRLFLRRYRVSTVLALPVGRDPATVTGALAASLGPPERIGGVTAWFHVQHLLGTVTPTTFRLRVLLPVTTIVKPTSGALHGHQLLVATASSPLGTKSVSFGLSGRNAVVTTLCRGQRFQYGWICDWNSATVPNGTYALRSIVTDAAGRVSTSAPVVVDVHN